MIFLFQRPFRPGISRRSAIFLGLWRAIPPGECWLTTQKGGPGYSGDMMGYHPPPLKMYGEGAFPPPLKRVFIVWTFWGKIKRLPKEVGGAPHTFSVFGLPCFIVAYPRNYGQNIVDEAGRMVAFPSLKKPLWEDLKATVPTWFHEHGGLCDMHSKAYSHFRTIAPCQGKGPVKFLAWMKELTLLVEDPLPVDDHDALSSAVDCCRTVFTCTQFDV